MKYRKLGNTGLDVSEIGFGAWAIGGRSEAAGTQWGWGEVPEDEAIAAVRRARELGVNLFDTADVYGGGRSEEILGKALGENWQGAIVASKVGNVVKHGVAAKEWGREHLVRSCEASLKRLRKDVIEIYQLHNPDLYHIRHGDWPETMELLQRQGKVRFYGVSVFLPEEATAVMARGKGHALQVAYNGLRLEMEAAVLPLAQRKGWGIIARVPLYYGVLTGKFTAETTFPPDDHRSHTLPPSVMRELAPRAERLRELAGETDLATWSLKFALSHPAVSTVIAGARNAQQVERNCAVSDAPEVSPEQFQEARRRWQEDAWLRELRTGL